MNMTESEDQAQRNVFDWARWQKGKYPQLKAMYHAANEGKRSTRAGAELKRQGMKPGVSDICLPYASGKYNNLYVELKVGNNKASDNQLKFIDTINGIGGKAVIAYGSEAAISVITAYLEGTIDSLEIASDTYPPEKAKITERANKKRFIGFCGAEHGNEAPAAEREAAAAEREGLQMKAIEWLRGKLHIEPDERKIGKKYYEKCDKGTATELEASYSTYMILKDKGYEPDDILILLEEDNGKFTGKKLTVQVYSTEREIEGLLDGYCVLMVENMGLAAWKVK